jgi:hypothetical protein
MEAGKTWMNRRNGGRRIARCQPHQGADCEARVTGAVTVD